VLVIVLESKGMGPASARFSKGHHDKWQIDVCQERRGQREPDTLTTSSHHKLTHSHRNYINPFVRVVCP
jgi:hypothetical protein